MEILYRDAQIVACVKPVGLDAEHQVPAALAEALGGKLFPVHRLDRNVGGVMLYARTKEAAATLSQSIQSGEMVKEYVALVHGVPPEQGTWTDLVWKDSRKNKVYVVNRLRGGVKQAKLDYTRLRAGERSLVHIRLHTGRSHQIRVQFASRGYPLVGDHKYGARDSSPAPMLYSCRISLLWQGQERAFCHLPDWATGLDADLLPVQPQAD